MKTMRMKKKNFVHIMLIVIVSFLLLGCNNGNESIKIGVIMPQTGSLAEPGRNIIEGIELAVEEYNNLCNTDDQKIKLIIEDSKSLSRYGVSALNKLIHQDKVKVVIGDLSSDVFLACAPIAEKNRVVMISPGASNPNVRYAGDFIFRDYLSDEFDGMVMADYVYSRMRKERAAIVFVNGDYGIGVKDAFVKQYNILGGKVVFIGSFTPGTTDFKSMVLKIKEADPNVLYIAGNPAENGYLVKQLWSYGIRIPITGTLAFENNDFITVAEGFFDTITYSTAAYDVNSELPVVKDFVVSYKKRYNKNPDMAAGLGYDVVNILVQSLKAAGYNLSYVKDQLYNIQDFVGVTGITSFDSYGDVLKDIYIKRMMGDGKISFVESYKFTNPNIK